MCCNSRDQSRNSDLQSNEAGSSNACELLGFKRSMSYLTETEGLSIKSIVTDRHLSIGAFIRDDLKMNNEKCADMEHYNDVWHTAKGCTTIKY